MQKEETKRRMKRMEELSYIDEVDKFIQSKAVWQDFNQIDKKRVASIEG